MRIVLMGSPAFTLPTLDALVASGREVVAVVTQPDRPAGRGHALVAPPVKVAALERGLRVLQPENVSALESIETLRSLEPDVFVVAAYGQILRQRLLEVPRRGSLNVHASLLPRHRGASPIAAAILAGDETSGVSIMEVVRALDAGPMVAKAEEPILPSDTAGSLEERLSQKGARLLISVLDPWFNRELDVEPQDDSQATYAPQIKREDAGLDWSLPAVELWRRVRAFNPWPIAHARWGGEELRILDAWPVEGSSSDVPAGTVTEVDLSRETGAAGRSPAVQTGHGALALLRLQRPGRNAMTGGEFLRGRPDMLGSRLG